ncbi:unnamed protein product [Brassica rapa subsp. narinosa]
MWNQKPSFRFEIDNYSEKPSIQIQSKTFVAGGCEWYLNAFPKGGYLAVHDHFSLFLQVANRTMLPTGWKRKVSFYFTLLNQSDKELFRSNIVRCQVLDVKGPSWGFEKLCPLSKLQENGVLEKDRLIIEVYINLIEAVDGESGDVSGKEETMDINGFKVLASQVTLVRKIFAEHPDTAVGLKSKNQVLKTAYMNVLIGLINTLNKPSHNHSETELTKAGSELSELEEVGFKLDWLKSKLEEVSLERKKEDVYGNKVIQLEERVKNLEQMENKMKRKIVECFLERKKGKDDGSRVQTLEERVNYLEAVDSSSRLDCLTLKSKSGGVSLEKMKKVDDADASRVQQLEENLKNLEEIVSDLKVKLDEGKEKTSCDGFLLVGDDETFFFEDMEKAFSWEIDNFSERNGVIRSDPFTSGGCEWLLCVHPKGKLVDDHLSLFLHAVNPVSLLPGWRRRASYHFVLLNQSGKVLSRTVEELRFFCAEAEGRGSHRMLPLTKLQEEGFLEDNKLTIEVYIKVVKVVAEGNLTGNEMVDFRGFHVLNRQAVSVSNIFVLHPDVAVDIRSGIKEVKTAYMNILLGLVETLDKAPQSLSETELTNAESELSELEEAGFKLDWLKPKLEEFSLKRKQATSSPRVSPFECIDFLVKRFFLSCFSEH